MTSICVVTMGRGVTLSQTMDAVFEFAEQPYEVIVVDNGSTDDASRRTLDGLDDRCTVIRNESNLGLSRATNQGLAAASYPTLIHMDDDALITLPGWNQAFARFFDAHPEVGAASPDRGNVGVIRHGTYTEVRWFLGMVWALRKEVFEAVGGYDEQLVHQQECDLCLRVRMFGYRAAQCPQVPGTKVKHNDSAPQSRASKARENLGTVQFHDKWTEYFLGRGWSYGRTPRYLMQHFPVDLEFFERLGRTIGLNSKEETMVVDGQKYWVHRDIRPDRAFAEAPDGHGWEAFKTEIIAEWKAVTGRDYTGYDWGRIPYACPA